MKLKRLLSILAILCVIVTFAANTQRVLKIYSHNEVVGSFPITVIDSIKIDKSNPSDKLIKIYSSDNISELSVANIDSIKIVEEIDPSQIPDNEIWYTTVENTLFDEFQTSQPFNVNIISNTYENGIGKIKCDGSIKKINDMAFCNVVSHITNLYLPNCVEHLCYAAIFGISAKKIHIPEKLKVIEHNGLYLPEVEEFTGTEDSRSVVIDGVLYAYVTQNITEYTTPLNVKIIGSNTNEYNKNIKRFICSENVETIDYGAFMSCDQLEYIKLNNGLKTIGNFSFFGCSNLKEIEFPNTLHIIGDLAFSDTNIEIVNIPESITNLHGHAFVGCVNIKEFRGKYASKDNMFLHNKGYMFAYAIGAGKEEYSIPEGINLLESYTFKNDKHLRKISFPSSMQYIRDYAFQGCDNLEMIDGPLASEDNCCAIKNDTILTYVKKSKKEYHVPQNAKIILSGVFNGIKDLEKLVLSDNIEKVGVDLNNSADNGYRGSFISDCPNLKTVTLSAKLMDLGCGFLVIVEIWKQFSVVLLFLL